MKADIMPYATMKKTAKARRRKAPTPSLFSGLLYCVDCGYPMAGGFNTSNRRSGRVKIYYYSCRFHRRTGRTQCSWHTIPEPVLIQVVREDMQKQLDEVAVDEEREKLDAQAAKLYEDRLNGSINLDTFMRFSADAEAGRIEVQSEHEKLLQALESAGRQTLDIGRWISGIRSCFPASRAKCRGRCRRLCCCRRANVRWLD